MSSPQLKPGKIWQYNGPKKYNFTKGSEVLPGMSEATKVFVQFS